MDRIELDAQCISKTVEILRLRIQDRFPDSGLFKVCSHLVDVAKQTRLTIRSIGSPIWSMRMVAILVIVSMVGFVGWLVVTLRHDASTTFEEGIQIAEAATNLFIFFAIAMFWLWTSELKMRRARVIRAINRLREIAHVIDMHQLTKDPDSAFQQSVPTEHSPQRKMTPYELNRYLDYCSEMLSLIAKLGYLYISKFDDSDANQSAVELESLCSGLSRKIWQKIMVLQSLGNRYPEKLEPTPPSDRSTTAKKPSAVSEDGKAAGAEPPV